MRLLSILAVLLLITKPAYAYIGPAIAFLGYLLGPFAALIAAVAMIVGWPIYALIRKKRKKPAPEAEPKDPDSDTKTP